jgi:hypothetical protein
MSGRMSVPSGPAGATGATGRKGLRADRQTGPQERVQLGLKDRLDDWHYRTSRNCGIAMGPQRQALLDPMPL